MNKFVTKEEALRKAAEQLDISPSKYKQAIERFDSVKTYLLSCEYNDKGGKPEVYLQGSFKLGTEIRPYKDSKDADYDIDIVCRLEQKKENITPKKVKHIVGDLLKEHGTYAKMLDGEGKRCWTLNYAEQDSVGFHMDILPSVHESMVNQIDNRIDRSAIAVTNKCNVTGHYDWSQSNPKDFAAWFYYKNHATFEKLKQTQKKIIFDNSQRDGLFTSQDAVPDIHVKTPLQRTIQLLKRHRDIRFCSLPNEKCKPISMIITVLAASIYDNELSIYETLKKLIDTLSLHAHQIRPTFFFDEKKARSDYPLITRTADGKWHIRNPTNCYENFADKWHETENDVSHARAKAFFQWVAWAKEDFLNINEQLDEEHFTKSLVSPINNKKLTVTQLQSLPFNVAHREKPYWPLNLICSAQISARYKTNGVWKGFNSGEPISKHISLLISGSTDVPAPFHVYWQVGNTGKEAEDARQLRGEIILAKTAGIGGLTQKESTLYTGVHWVEFFIVKNNICLARSGEFIVRIV